MPEPFDIRDLFAPHWKPPSDEPCDIWIENNLELGPGSDMQGKVRFDAVPMARHFLRACQDMLVKMVVLMVSAQSAKTKTAEFFLMWMIINRPREAIWYMDTNDSAKMFSQTRLQSDLDSTPAIAAQLPQDRDKNKWGLVRFDTMNLYVMGANAKRNRERISAEVVLCDERRNYPPGAMSGIRNRYKTFLNWKEISFSTAGTENDDLHVAFKQGSQTLFHFTCPHCKHSQPFRFSKHATTIFEKPRAFGGLVWDDNEVTHPEENVYNWSELAKTVRYECENEACRHLFSNGDKAALILTLHPVDYNQLASPDHKSFHWNELYMPWSQTSWENIVIKFLKAEMAVRLRGDIEPLKTFIQESLGEPWREQAETAEPEKVLERCGDFPLGEKMPVEHGERTAMVMTVDVQNGYLKYVVRQHKKSYGTRLIAFGKVLDDPQELLKLAEQHGVSMHAVFIDCAWFTQTSKRGTAPKVLEWCATFGWNAMLGDNPRGLYTHRVEKRKGEIENVERGWKEMQIESGLGTAGRRVLVRRIMWVNDHYKNKLYLHSMRGIGRAWELPAASQLPKEYIEEMSCTDLMIIQNPDGTQSKQWKERGRHDYADCEQMQLVVDDMYNPEA